MKGLAPIGKRDEVAKHTQSGGKTFEKVTTGGPAKGDAIAVRVGDFDAQRQLTQGCLPRTALEQSEIRIRDQEFDSDEDAEEAGKVLRHEHRSRLGPAIVEKRSVSDREPQSAVNEIENAARREHDQQVNKTCRSSTGK